MSEQHRSPFPLQPPMPMMMYMVPMLLPAETALIQPPVPMQRPVPPPPPRSPSPQVPTESYNVLSPRSIRLNADIADLLAFDSSDTDSLISDVSSEDSSYTIPDLCDLNRCTTIETAGRIDTCGICTEDILPSSIVRAIPCQHLFHIACLDRALEDRNSCPICRARIIAPEA